MNQFRKIIRSTAFVVIYVTVKVILTAWLVWFFLEEQELGLRIIYLSFAFLLVMSMVPILMLRHLELQKPVSDTESTDDTETNEVKNPPNR